MMNFVEVIKDLKEYRIYTETGILADNNKLYPCITVNCENTEISAIYINDEWHEINKFRFE